MYANLGVCYTNRIDPKIIFLISSLSNIYQKASEIDTLEAFKYIMVHRNNVNGVLIQIIQVTYHYSRNK